MATAISYDRGSVLIIKLSINNNDHLTWESKSLKKCHIAFNHTFCTLCGSAIESLPHSSLLQVILTLLSNEYDY